MPKPKGEKSTKKTTKKTDSTPRAPKGIEYPSTVKGYNSTTKSIWHKAMTTNSRKSAIRAMCLMCLGGSVKEVKDCTEGNKCPLWKFRLTG